MHRCMRNAHLRMHCNVAAAQRRPEPQPTALCRLQATLSARRRRAQAPQMHLVQRRMLHLILRPMTGTSWCPPGLSVCHPKPPATPPSSCIGNTGRRCPPPSLDKAVSVRTKDGTQRRHICRKAQSSVRRSARRNKNIAYGCTRSAGSAVHIFALICSCHQPHCARRGPPSFHLSPE